MTRLYALIDLLMLVALVAMALVAVRAAGSGEWAAALGTWAAATLLGLMWLRWSGTLA